MAVMTELSSNNAAAALLHQVDSASGELQNIRRLLLQWRRLLQKIEESCRKNSSKI